MPAPMAPPSPEQPRGAEEQRQQHRDPSDLHEVQRMIRESLRRTGRQHVDVALGSSSSFDGRLARHLRRLPARYHTDHLAADDRAAEDVLLHWRILDECADPEKRPVFHARFVTSVVHGRRRPDTGGDHQELDDPCQSLMEDDLLPESSPALVHPETLCLHEIIFASSDMPKLLHRLTGFLADEIGLNIQQAHVYTTTDGFCLGIFVVDGWETEDAADLIANIKEALARRSA